MSFVASNISFFGPRQVPGLALWLDASDATTIGLLSNTQNVTQWRDKSGRNNNATPFGTGSPTYSSNSIVFTGTQAFGTTLSSLMSNQSGFAIVRYSSSNKINILSVNRTSGTAAIQQIIQNNVQSLTTYGATLIVSGATLTQNTMLLYNHTFSATCNAFIYLNGSQRGTSTGPYTFTGAGTINIGGYDTTPGEGFIGSMNEIILYSNVLTTLQRQQIEGHLAWKWGLQANLPAGHPYRFNSQQAIYPFTTIQTPFTNTHLPYYSDFSPRSIGGCRLWLDAADTSSVILSNGAITQWNDKSGFTNNATQATASNRPLYSNSFVSLNGVNQFFNVNLDFLAGVSHNSFIVIRNFNYTNIYGAATGGLSSNSLHIGFNSAGAYRMNFWGNDWYPAITANYKVNQTNLLNFNWVHNTSKIIYANGGLEGTSNQAGIIGTMAGGGRIGNVANSTGVFNPAFISANIYEMIIYTGTLTTTQRQQIEAYLSSKWGLLGNLASSNPYRANIRTLIYPNITISRPPVYSVTRNGVRWTPLEIPVLALWLDAADTASLSLSGTAVTQWRDKSGNGRNAIISGTIVYNNLNVITNGVSPNSFSAPLNIKRTVLSNLNMFIVYNQINTSNPLSQGLYGNDVGGGWNRFQLLNNNGTFDYRISAGFLSGVAQVIPITNINNTNRQIYNVSYSLSNINSSFVFLNGTLNATFTEYASQTETSTSNILFGTINNTSIFGNVNFNEIIIYTRSITTTERQKVEGYLAYKWGLRSSLPTNHPYKNIPVS